MTLAVRRVRAVMVFVDDPLAAARFWGGLFGARVDPDLALVDLGSFELFFQPADEERDPAGGTVVYLEAGDFDAAREALLAAGCESWRGPLAIESGRRICQVRDPFGTVWGLISP